MTAVMRKLFVILFLPLFMLSLIPSRLTLADEPPRKGIENPAALQNFFRALADARSGWRLEPVRIMHFGDSHTAADVLTAEIRRKFQRDFGDGGAGFIVPKNPMSTRRLGVTSGATSGWVIEGIGGRIAPDRIYGPAGIALSTSKPGERAWVEAASNHFELYYVRQPGGGRVDVFVDGASVLDSPLSLQSTTPEAGHLFFDSPANARHRVEVRTLTSGKVRILGIVTERIEVSRPDGVISVLEDLGNTSSASMGIAFDKLRQFGPVKAGDYLLLPAFAAGFTWGAALCRVGHEGPSPKTRPLREKDS